MRDVDAPPEDTAGRGLAVAALSVQEVTARLARLLQSPTREQVWAQVVDFCALLGFSSVIYARAPESRGTALGDPGDFQILSTLPPEVMRTLVDDGHFRNSVTFHWALHNVGVVSFSTPREAVPGAPPAYSSESLDFFDRNNLWAGCMVGLPQERTRGKAVMALIAPRSTTQDHVDAILAVHEDLVFTLAAVAHRCLGIMPLDMAGRSLTPRQREVLEWVGQGKTCADIAVIMGITPPTVEKHLRLAREALGVDTTAHALMKAAFLNQMFTPLPGADDGGPRDAG